MSGITLPAHAKINLTLDVLGKRADGYHELQTVMHTIALHDILRIQPVTRRNRLDFSQIVLKSDCAALPLGEENIAYRAAKFMQEEFRLDNIEIFLQKRIPIGAGLAGGSSNCAAVLKGLNILFDLGLSVPQLCEIGARFGADVPFCVLGGTALAEGIGEKLTPLPPPPDCRLLLLTPNVHCSTATIFGRYACGAHQPNSPKMVAALKSGSFAQVCENLGNDLTAAACAEHPQIGKILEYLQKQAPHANMSGSGASCFALFAEDSAEEIKKILPNAAKETDYA